MNKNSKCLSLVLSFCLVLSFNGLPFNLIVRNHLAPNSKFSGKENDLAQRILQARDQGEYILYGGGEFKEGRRVGGKRLGSYDSAFSVSWAIKRHREDYKIFTVEKFKVHPDGQFHFLNLYSFFGDYAQGTVPTRIVPKRFRKMV